MQAGQSYTGGNGISRKPHNDTDCYKPASPTHYVQTVICDQTHPSLTHCGSSYIRILPRAVFKAVTPVTVPATPGRLRCNKECSQSAAWTTNQSLHVASCVEAFPRRPTNSCTTLPRAAHQEGGVISVSPHTREVLRHVPKCDYPPALSCTPTIHHLHPCPTQLTVAMTNYTHAPTGTNSSALQVLL